MEKPISGHTARGNGNVYLTRNITHRRLLIFDRRKKGGEEELSIATILRMGKNHPTTSPLIPMLSKCANPDCTTEFKYFRHGRLFEFNLGAGMCYNTLPPQKGSSRELFWLCHECSRKLTLECSGGQIVPVPRTAVEHRAA